MKIVYFGYNALSSCLDLLSHTDDIIIVAIYTGEDNAHTDQIIQIAQQSEAPLLTQKPTLIEMKALVDDGVDAFICAEYPYKIPLPSSLKYSVNIHPTLLPEGRGQTPLPHLILSQSQYAGITLHKMTDEFDCGEILIQEKIVVKDNDTFDSLHAKVFLQAPMLLQQLLSDWGNIFLKATAQKGGSYWPSICSNQQSINWSMSNKDIELISRAFASLGVAFNLNDKEYYYTSGQCIIFKHAYRAGDVISFDEFKLVIATLEGLIIIPRPCLFEL